MSEQENNEMTEMSQEELEEYINEKLKPFQERISNLEDLEKTKEAEIITLKYAIERLHSIIDNL